MAKARSRNSTAEKVTASTIVSWRLACTISRMWRRSMRFHATSRIIPPIAADGSQRPYGARVSTITSKNAAEKIADSGVRAPAS